MRLILPRIWERLSGVAAAAEARRGEPGASTATTEAAAAAARLRAERGAAWTRPRRPRPRPPPDPRTSRRAAARAARPSCRPRAQPAQEAAAAAARRRRGARVGARERDLADGLRHAVLGVAPDDMVRAPLRDGDGVAHCDGRADEVEHLEVVLAVADGHDVGRVDAERVEQRGDAARLRRARRQDLERPVERAHDPRALGPQRAREPAAEGGDRGGRRAEDEELAHAALRGVGVARCRLAEHRLHRRHDRPRRQRVATAGLRRRRLWLGLAIRPVLGGALVEAWRDEALAAVGANGHAVDLRARLLHRAHHRRRQLHVVDPLAGAVERGEALQKDARRQEVEGLEDLIGPRTGACAASRDHHAQARVARREDRVRHLWRQLVLRIERGAIRIQDNGGDVLDPTVHGTRDAELRRYVWRSRRPCERREHVERRRRLEQERDDGDDEEHRRPRHQE